MSRIGLVTSNTAQGRTKELLDAIQKKLGMTPNITKAMANAPATLDAYLAMSGALAKGRLGHALRERIALTVGEANDCRYCLAAHTAVAGSLGLTREEVLDSRAAISTDPKTAAALRFAREIVEERGRVSDEAVHHVREAGFTDGDITEIIANVVLNLFTNYFNHVAETPVDFPETEPLAVAKR